MATITPTELAEEIGTTPRTVRKFLRSEQGKGTKVGKGARWAIEKREVAALKKRFTKWFADEAKARAERATARAAAAETAANEAETDIEDEALETE